MPPCGNFEPAGDRYPELLDTLDSTRLRQRFPDPADRTQSALDRDLLLMACVR